MEPGKLKFWIGFPKVWGSRTEGAEIPSPQVWPAWVKMLPCVPHSLGRSLRAGWEEPDSQALCVPAGPGADSPEAPGSVAGPVRPP